MHCRCLNTHSSGVVYLLWGGFAQKKGKIVNASKNHVLQCAHPSPMVYDLSFIVNAYLINLFFEQKTQVWQCLERKQAFLQDQQASC